jgi:pimeloyl-ACP methyl ester carboxylesterase
MKSSRNVRNYFRMAAMQRRTFTEQMALLGLPRSWTERAYPKLIYYNKLDKGGHFAAWEQPELFSQELRAAFKSMR